MSDLHNHFLNSRAEIHQTFPLDFWKIEDTKKSFWDYLTFSCQLKSSTNNKCHPKFFVVWCLILKAFLNSISFKTKWSTFLINRKSCYIIVIFHFIHFKKCLYVLESYVLILPTHKLMVKIESQHEILVKDCSRWWASSRNWPSSLGGLLQARGPRKALIRIFHSFGFPTQKML